MLRPVVQSLLVILILLAAQSGYGQSACDKNKECVGNALTMTVTNGKLAQYVDVDTNAALRAIRTGLTFETWMKPVAQPGKKVFVGGLWGPNKDNNDQWVVYLRDNTIYFELSQDNSFQGPLDNTVVQSSVADLYTRGWVHLAVTWDAASTMARIYIDGAEAASGNSPFAVTALKRVESRTLTMQLGSTNALFEDSTVNRSFKGQLDEIRLWNKALTAQQIACQRLLSLVGNEAGMVFYYRCNQDNTTQNLCDASSNAIPARMRSGAVCTPSDRKVNPTYTITPASLTDKLVCISSKSYTFSVTDTTICGSQVRLSIQGRDAAFFSLSRTTLALTQGQPQTFDVTVNAVLVGTLNAQLVLSNSNRCGDDVIVPIAIERTTELTYSFGRIVFDTLIAGCIEKPFTEQTVRICNTTTKPLQLFSVRLDSNRFTLRPADASKALPYTLAPGECWDVIVRFDAQDTTKTWWDTLRVASDEACAGAGNIALIGHTQEVFALLTGDGRSRLVSLDLGAVCPEQTSNSRIFQYRSLLKNLRDTVRIENIEFTPAFFGYRFRFPLKLVSQQAYQPTFVRFRPPLPGPYTGEMKVTASYNGCTIVKMVQLRGRGISVDIRFESALVGFGNITIGKADTQTVTVRNYGQDDRRLSAYFKIGDVFSFISGRSFNIGVNATKDIRIEFRPREQKIYYDTLCVFDEDCYQTTCIPVQGGGRFDALEYTPSFVAIDNIIGCQCGEATVKVKNISGVTQNLAADRLTDPSGKFSLLARPSMGSLAPNAEVEYKVRYCPNDVRDDRSDQAYISIDLAGGEKYSILLRASSAAPKVYVTPLTTFNVVEAGWSKQDSVLVENISSVPVNINRITVPPGYRILNTVPAVPTQLAPRDSLWVHLVFEPRAEQPYNGPISVEIDAPCPITHSGQLTGEGKTAKLQVPVTFVNFSLVKPCDCREREIPLNNTSYLQNLFIDSIWIDGAGVTPLVPSVFKWGSKLTGSTTLPYTIPPQASDTLVVQFCPDIPATQANQVKNDTIHILARSTGWSREFEAMLSGRREVNFSPNRALIAFPATRVDTLLAPQTLELTIPDAFLNPSGDSIVITNITFKPDQRVFTARAATGQPLPWVLRRGDKFQILVDFRPRAPRDYEARMQIHTTFPCNSVDTTVLVRGSGFAPAFGLQMAFDTNAIGRDTTWLTTCDTLTLPVMITRAIPQPLIDMLFRIQYDSTALRLLDIVTSYTPTASVSDTGDGARAYLKNARNVEAGTFAYVRFVVIDGPRAFPVLLDDIGFDSDSLVNFKIVAGIDQGFVVIDRPVVDIAALVDFDTVNVKTCEDQQVTITNPGAIPIRFDSVGLLPRWTRVTASSKPLPVDLAHGDSVFVTLTYCPRAEEVIDTLLLAHSSDPCNILDSSMMRAIAYAPPFPFAITFDSSRMTLDSVQAIIADTISIPVMVDRDIILSPIDARFSFLYNARSLQYLTASSSYGSVDVQFTASGIDLAIEDCDSVRSGEVARLTFRVIVPDSVVSSLRIIPGIFTSDSIMFVKPVPTGDSAFMCVQPRCNISRLNFTGGTSELTPPMPNPANGLTRIEFEYFEDVTASMQLFTETGAIVLEPIAGNEPTKAGRYMVEIDTRTLATGAYYYRVKAGKFVATRKLVVIK